MIKNINNNVSICVDSRNREAVVFGKGVGFIKPPHEISPEAIERIYYRSEQRPGSQGGASVSVDEASIDRAMADILEILTDRLQVWLAQDSFEYMLLYMHIAHLIRREDGFCNEDDLRPMQDQEDRNIDRDVLSAVDAINGYLKEHFAVEDNWVDRYFGLLLLSRIKKTLSGAE